MKSKFISRNRSNRLILIFAGWGMDWRPFIGLEHCDYDILVVWDYRDLTFDCKQLTEYDEICLLAWSMGVFAASVSIYEILPKITMRIAINGTLTPIDNTTGIPPAIWHATLNALSPASLRKFHRRMCDSAAQYENFREVAPKRNIDELKEELIALETHTLFHVEQVTDWDMAIISRHDAIFPAKNQLNAWRPIAPTRILDNGHLPDFAMLVSRMIKDKRRVEECFDKAGTTYAQNAIVQKQIARKLMRHFDTVYGTDDIVGNIIEIGVGDGGSLTDLWYKRTDPRAKLLLWDLVDVDTKNFAPRAVFEKCDAEVRIRRQPSESARFIFSTSTIQWFNSLRNFINECNRVLVPGGYLAFSSFVHGNLEELTSVTGNGLQLPTPSDWKRLIPDSMEILVFETAEYTLEFPTVRDVLHHFRLTGVNGVNYGQTRVTLTRHILREYPADPATGKYKVTYRPIFIIARKRDITVSA